MNEEATKQVERIMERAKHEILSVVLAIEPPASEVRAPAPDGMMGITKACQYLECSETHIRGMVRDGLLPERRVGARLRFKPSELDAATEVKARLKEAS